MELGYIGLGKMGFNMVRRLLEKGHSITVFDRSAGAVKEITKHGAVAADSIKTLVQKIAPPRVVWIMVPHNAVDAVLGELVPVLGSGDIVIDGGNSPYKESMRRSRELEAKSVEFLDAGVSGGPAGARDGACVMVGGRKEMYMKLEPLFQDISTEKGYGYMGRAGSGHFVKMVHNGIEYGMMQALAEGFAVMKASDLDLDLARIADLYNRRSVIESRLVEWLKAAYEMHGRDLAGVSGSAAQSGEGKWTVDAARELGVPVPVIAAALDFRTRSEKDPSYAGRIIAALRNQFGGHAMQERKG